MSGLVTAAHLSSEAELPAERRRRGEAGRDCRFLRLRSRARALFSFSFSRSLSFFSFFCPWQGYRGGEGSEQRGQLCRGLKLWVPTYALHLLQ